MPSPSLPPSPRLRPRSEFVNDLKGFVDHVEEYRRYVELKTQMEQMKKNLLVQDYASSNKAGLAKSRFLNLVIHQL